MAGKYGKIYKSVWNDPDFRSLSMEAQNLYWMLSSSEQTSFAGVLPLAPGRFIDLAANLTEKKFTSALRELERKKYVLVDKKSLEIMVRTFIKWDESLRNKNLSVAVGRAIEMIFSRKLRANLAEELARHMADSPELIGWEVLAETVPAFFDTLTETYVDAISPGNSTKNGEDPSEAPSQHPSERYDEYPEQDPSLPVRFPMPS